MWKSHKDEKEKMQSIEEEEKKRRRCIYDTSCIIYIYIGKDKVIDIAVSLAILLVFDKTTVMVW